MFNQIFLKTLKNIWRKSSIILTLVTFPLMKFFWKIISKIWLRSWRKSTAINKLHVVFDILLSYFSSGVFLSIFSKTVKYNFLFFFIKVLHQMFSNTMKFMKIILHSYRNFSSYSMPWLTNTLTFTFIFFGKMTMVF